MEYQYDTGKGIEITTDRPYIPRGDALDKRVAMLLSLKAEGKTPREIAEVMCPGMDIFEKDCAEA